jgi:succinate dehydrogenase/fumarate reductase cytochrome b subunit
MGWAPWSWKEKKNTHKKRAFVSITGGVLFFFFSLFHFFFSPLSFTTSTKEEYEGNTYKGGSSPSSSSFCFLSLVVQVKKRCNNLEGGKGVGSK